MVEDLLPLNEKSQYLSTQEMLGQPTLQKKSSTTADSSPDDIAPGVEELVSEERGGVIDEGRSAPSANSSRSLGERVHYPLLWKYPLPWHRRPD